MAKLDSFQNGAMTTLSSASIFLQDDLFCILPRLPSRPSPRFWQKFLKLKRHIGKSYISQNHGAPRFRSVLSINCGEEGSLIGHGRLLLR
jgi:hypothetical protein